MHTQAYTVVWVLHEKVTLKQDLAAYINSVEWCYNNEMRERQRTRHAHSRSIFVRGTRRPRPVSVAPTTGAIYRRVTRTKTVPVQASSETQYREIDNNA